MNYVKPELKIVDFAAMEQLAKMPLDPLDQTSVIIGEEGVAGRDDFTNP